MPNTKTTCLVRAGEPARYTYEAPKHSVRVLRSHIDILRREALNMSVELENGRMAGDSRYQRSERVVPDHIEPVDISPEDMIRRVAVIQDSLTEVHAALMAIIEDES